jgi:peptidoglycan/LPS O-acetylase OafA/YrhL
MGDGSQSAGRAFQFRSIDLLRGAAALGVAIYHVRVYLWAGSREILGHQSGFSWAERGFAVFMVPSFFFDSGVVLFFVISGFCVHWPMASKTVSLGEGVAKPVWRSYFMRRFLRLYPPYVAALLVTLLLEWMATRFAGAESSSVPIFNSLVMLQNYLPPHSQMTGNPALWSVPVEAELYLVYPILLCIKRWMGWWGGLGLVAVVSLGASFYAAHGWERLAGSFLKFWIIWAAGAALAESVARGGLPRFGPAQGIGMIAAGGLAVMLASTEIGHEWTHLAYGVCFVMALWWLIGREKAGTSKFHSSFAKGMCFTGERSYSLYLLHFPLFFFIGKLWEAKYGFKPGTPWLALAALGLSVLAAFIFYKCVERPSHQLARTVAKALS